LINICQQRAGYPKNIANRLDSSLACISILPDSSQLRGHANPGWLSRNRLPTIWPVQAKLAINQPGDRYEEEADRVAEQVVRIPDHGGSVPSQPPTIQRSCPRCKKAGEREEDEEPLQMKPLPAPARGAAQASPSSVPPIVHEVLRSPGRPLDAATRAFMEPRFGQDFSRVRIHTDVEGAQSAMAVNALAYTVGSDVVFGKGQLRLNTIEGQKLLAHELVHTIQQEPASGELFGSMGAIDHMPSGDAAENDADRLSTDIIRAPWGKEIAMQKGIQFLQRSPSGASGVSVRSPVFEETVTLLSDVGGAVAGRRLTRDEQALAESVFGQSIDYTRVRLVPADLLRFRTVGNNIYIPRGFTISDRSTAQTLIHELTHVWQYQHGGTSYISISLGTQIAASIRRGNRNFAYDYQIYPGQSFFDFTPEQQGFIVENYFAMLRDQEAIPLERSTGRASTYESNHLDSTGYKRQLSGSDRQAEIARELPLHEPLIQQLRTALPSPEASILMLRARDLMTTPGSSLESVPTERQLIPVRPFLEIPF